MNGELGAGKNRRRTSDVRHLSLEVRHLTLEVTRLPPGFQFRVMGVSDSGVDGTPSRWGEVGGRFG
ncbi:MAG: hypothetical protein EA381_01800 [Planctomycetaceae bacterium]|nr:MAG: hypothetical protein EA381_01800 [Planctomycetaceae bacterium]